MNSLLQVLFFITKCRTAFRKIKNESATLMALSDIFERMESAVENVRTEKLTDSFGWSEVDVTEERDVHEFLRMLMAAMNVPSLERTISSIFQGKAITNIKCQDVDFSSEVEEVFDDIQLSLENSSNVYESFEQYVSPELMDGNNK